MGDDFGGFFKKVNGEIEGIDVEVKGYFIIQSWGEEMVVRVIIVQGEYIFLDICWFVDCVIVDGVDYFGDDR